MYFERYLCPKPGISNTLTFMKDFSYVTQSHPAYMESLYQEFVKDPQSVDPDLRKFFEGFDFAVNAGKLSMGASSISTEMKGESVSTDWQTELKVYRLILGYRNKGHLIATTNPIRTRKDRGAHIRLADFELTEQDMDRTFQVGQLVGLSNATLRIILEKLNACYASNVGVEYKYKLKMALEGMPGQNRVGEDGKPKCKNFCQVNDRYLKYEPIFVFRKA